MKKVPARQRGNERRIMILEQIPLWCVGCCICSLKMVQGRTGQHSEISLFSLASPIPRLRLRLLELNFYFLLYIVRDYLSPLSLFLFVSFILSPIIPLFPIGW